MTALPTELVAAERICVAELATSKDGVLARAAALLATSCPGTTPQSVLESLLERERHGSTGFGNGVALPHARVPGLDHPIGAFIRLSTCVDFEAADGGPVDLVFALLVPQEQVDHHLQMLAALAGLFGREEVRWQLRQAGTVEAAAAVLLAESATAGNA